MNAAIFAVAEELHARILVEKPAPLEKPEE